MGTVVSSAEDAAAAGQHIHELLDGQQVNEAIAFAEGCDGPEQVTDQLKALAYTEAGVLRNDRELLNRAVGLWKKAGAERLTELGYNLANAQYELWRQLVRERGYVAALRDDRGRLQDARARFYRSGHDVELPLDRRIRALTNLANSYDSEGRDVEAIAVYDEVLKLDGSFGMALANKGLALLDIAPFAGQHRPTVLAEGITALDAGLENEVSILQHGGPAPLDRFRARRAQYKVSPSFAPHRHERTAWTEPYFRWCAQEGLFLHVSPVCLSEASEELDPLYFDGITVGLDEGEQHRAYDLIDAFNALKQDYLSARYLIWLASGVDSPIREHAARTAVRAGYLDTLRHARWGPRTGLAGTAFADACNILDKVASAVHLYYRTSRNSHAVYFRYLWHPKHGKNKPDEMDPELVHAAPTRGLRALCDLSCELETKTPLNDLVERRHTATHRFLTVHRLPKADDGLTSDWLEHVAWDDLVAGSITLLGTARSALIYLVRMIDIEERRLTKRREEAAEGTGRRSLAPPLPLPRSAPESTEPE